MRVVPIGGVTLAEGACGVVRYVISGARRCKLLWNWLLVAFIGQGPTGHWTICGARSGMMARVVSCQYLGAPHRQAAALAEATATSRTHVHSLWRVVRT